TVYRALRVGSDGIHRMACATREERRAVQAKAVLSLVTTDLVSGASILRGRPVQERLALSQYPYGGIDALVSDAALAAAARLIAGRRGAPVLAVADFEHLRAAARAQIPGAVAQAISAVAPALVSAQKVSLRLDDAPRELATAVRPGLDFLVGEGFLARHPASVLPHLDRHVRAVDLRLDLAEKSPARHRELSDRLARSESAVEE